MRFLFLLPLFLTFYSFGQNFSIGDTLYSQNSTGEYEVFFSGNATFNDSMLVVYSVSTADSLQQVLFSDTVDFRSAPVTFPESFTYNAVDSTLHVDFGTYATKSLILVLYSEIEGNRRETIYVNIPTLETVLENEE